MIEAYPLCWPAGWPRMPQGSRRRARFSKGVRHYSSDGNASWNKKTDLSVTDSITRILGELSRMGIDRQDVVISTNVRTRLDGLPRSGERKPDDPGAAVYWTDTSMGNQPRCMAIDLYDRVADNLAAIAATIEAIRSIERHGGAKIMERAFQGFTALPAPGQTTRGWRDVLGATEKTSLTEAERLYKTLRSLHHPDRHGDPDIFHTVQAAWELAQQELK